MKKKVIIQYPSGVKALLETLNLKSEFYLCDAPDGTEDVNDLDFVSDELGETFAVINTSKKSARISREAQEKEGRKIAAEKELNEKTEIGELIKKSEWNAKELELIVRFLLSRAINRR